MFSQSPAWNVAEPDAARTALCRAGWTRHLLNGLREMPQEVAERVLAGIGGEHREMLDSSGPLRWLPFEVHMAVLGALRGVLGADVYRRFCFDRVSASLSLPELFEKPTKLALRLYGGPLALFRALTPSLPYIFRNAGSFRIDLQSGSAAVEAHHEDFPTRFAHGDTWHLIWAATFEALVSHAAPRGSELDAHVLLATHEPGRGYFRWRIELAAVPVSR